jgi:hypothetical protein
MYSIALGHLLRCNRRIGAILRCISSHFDFRVSRHVYDNLLPELQFSRDAVSYFDDGWIVTVRDTTSDVYPDMSFPQLPELIIEEAGFHLIRYDPKCDWN